MPVAYFTVTFEIPQVVLLNEVTASLCQVYHALVPTTGPGDPPCVPPPLSATSPPPDLPAGPPSKTSEDSGSNSLSARTPGAKQFIFEIFELENFPLHYI